MIIRGEVMINLSEMREKEVINIRDGSRMGFIYDFEIDLDKGRIVAIVLPGEGKILGLFGKNSDLVIDWNKIVRVGQDFILVDFGVDNSKILDNEK